VVEADAHEGDDVGAGGERAADEVAADRAHPVAEPGVGEAPAPAGHHGRQVEQGAGEVRVAARRGEHERPLAAAHVEQRAPAVERHRVEQLVGERRHGGGHERRVAAHVGRAQRRAPRRVDVRPVLGERAPLARLAAQVGHGVAQLFI
jgi:hypothetical protein